jgi:hypothetical protein
MAASWPGKHARHLVTHDVDCVNDRLLRTNRRAPVDVRDRECGADLAGERDRDAEVIPGRSDDAGGGGEQQSAANQAAALDHERDLGVGGQAVPAQVAWVAVVGHGRVVVEDGHDLRTVLGL